VAHSKQYTKAAVSNRSGTATRCTFPRFLIQDILRNHLKPFVFLCLAGWNRECYPINVNKANYYHRLYGIIGSHKFLDELAANNWGRHAAASAAKSFLEFPRNLVID
jgi:hypothetical protein